STCYAQSNNTAKNETFWAAYPNPVYDKLFVNPITTNMQVQYAIHNTNGRHIKSGNLDMQLGYASIDMTTLPRGLYVVSLQGDGKQETKKIIKA
ncbi:MAG: T9SS type A sorting domain-containing protein, partial [Flavobacteriaceae bacterium]